MFTWNVLYLIHNQLDILTQNDIKISHEVFEKIAFRWRHVMRFWVENGKFSRVSRTQSFEMKHNEKRQRVQSKKVCKMVIWSFQFVILTTKIQNYFFADINASKIKTSEDIHKIGMNILELFINHWPTKFRTNGLFFGCAMADKSSKCNVTSL